MELSQSFDLNGMFDRLTQISSSYFYFFLIILFNIRLVEN